MPSAALEIGRDDRQIAIRIRRRCPVRLGAHETGGLAHAAVARFDQASQEVADLERYIGYFRAGRYTRTAPHIQTPAVTSLTIETHLVADYREFLQAVASFLAHTRGIVANVRDLDAARFAAEFLSPA